MKTPEGHINLTHKISPQDPHPPNKTALTHSASPNIARETWAVTKAKRCSEQYTYCLI